MKLIYESYVTYVFGSSRGSGTACLFKEAKKNPNSNYSSPSSGRRRRPHQPNEVMCSTGSVGWVIDYREERALTAAAACCFVVGRQEEVLEHNLFWMWGEHDCVNYDFRCSRQLNGRVNVCFHSNSLTCWNKFTACCCWMFVLIACWTRGVPSTFSFWLQILTVEENSDAIFVCAY